jgi:iron complex outermembrane receptor protein
MAPPQEQGFGTTGGTIAYTTKKPTDDRYAELEGGYGTFDTSHFGFVLNSGKIGTGPDAPKVLLLYDQSYSGGYVDNTAAHYHDFMFNGIKPYDNGLSSVGLTIIYNQAKGLVQTLPTPTALIQAYGSQFNYPKSSGYYEQADQYLTAILSDHTFINQYAKFDGSLFYIRNNTTIDNFLSAQGSNGYNYGGLGYEPNVQGTYNFFGCVAGDTALSYDPSTYDNSGNCAEGEEDDFTRNTSNITGATPQLTLFPDEYNTIVIGGLIAKANRGTKDFIYGGAGGAADVEQYGYNEFDQGAEQRTIYSGYLQDTVRLLNNKLQITPGVKVDASYASHIEEVRYGNIDNHKYANFTKVGGYYLGAAYNLPDNFVLYGSMGKGSLFAPVTDFSAGLTAAGAPTGGTNTLEPELVHLYEGGIRYDTPKLLLNVDYYYENISDAFAYFENFLTDSEFYANNGGELYRGVEGNGTIQVTPQLSLFGNFSYNETEYTKSFFGFDTLSQDQFGYAFTGTPLSNVPDWNGLIGASYDYGPFSFYTTGQYTGREFTTYDLDAPPYGNTTDASGNTIPANPLDGATVTNKKIENPANFVWNVLLTYKIPVHFGALQSLTADLNLQNLLDEKYYTYTYSSENPVQGIYDPHIPGGEAYNSAFSGEPRSVMFDLTAKF